MFYYAEFDSLFWYLSQGTSSVPAVAALSAVTSGDLDLFTEQTTKSEEVAKKQLSKDSILSLYGTGTTQQQSAPGNAFEICFPWIAVTSLEVYSLCLCNVNYISSLCFLCSECICCCSLHNYKTEMKEALGLECTKLYSFRINKLVARHLMFHKPYRTGIIFEELFKFDLPEVYNSVQYGILSARKQ